MLYCMTAVVQLCSLNSSSRTFTACIAATMGVSLRHELRLERLRERLDDRPNDLHTTAQIGEGSHIVIAHHSSLLITSRMLRVRLLRV